MLATGGNRALYVSVSALTVFLFMIFQVLTPLSLAGAAIAL